MNRIAWPQITRKTFEPLLLPIAAVLISLLLGAVLLLALRVNPLIAYLSMFEGGFGSVNGLTQTIAKATPILLVSLGVIIAMRAGVLNIGGEGQITVGALATTAVALSFQEQPRIILLPLCLVTGFLAGSGWGAIAGFLKAQFNVNEVISTVMLNQIAFFLSNYLLRGPLIDPAEIERGTLLAQSAELPKHVWLVRIIPRTLFHSGAFIAFLLAIVVFLLLWRTTIGYQIRSVGLNPDASLYAGMRVRFYQMLSLILAGGMAGLAGSIELLGVQHRMVDGLSGGNGFSGVAVALFSKLHPLAAVPASFLFGGFLVGGDRMQRAVQVQSWLILVILGMTILFVVGSDIWSRRKQQQQSIQLLSDQADVGSQDNVSQLEDKPSE